MSASEHSSSSRIRGQPLRVLVAPQEFKGSLTANEAASAIERGVKRAARAVQVHRLPLSDGGPGLVRVLVESASGVLRTVEVDDPLGRPVQAEFGLLDHGRTAVIEMAAASGLTRLRTEELDPLRASSFGTGQLILAAIEQGATSLIIGIGGSATNDGGAGMAQAIGIRLLNGSGQELQPGGAALAGLDRIDLSGLDPRLKGVKVTAACDVSNPLLGPIGASAIYGPQKGATPEMVQQLDAALERYAAVIRRQLGLDVAPLPGAGAAGGLGAGLVTFLNAELRPGFPIVAEAVHLETWLDWSGIVLTGEGSMDAQTGFGKTVGGVLEMAGARGVPVVVLAGMLNESAATTMAANGTAVISVVPGPVTLEDALSHADEYLSARSTAVINAVAAGMRIVS